MWQYTELLTAALQWLYWACIGRWMWDVFRHGPAGLGFWASVPDQDMCARLASNTRSADWLEFDLVTPTRACTELIHRSFHSFAVIVHAALYVVLLITVARAISACFARRYCAPALALRICYDRIENKAHIA